MPESLFTVQTPAAGNNSDGGATGITTSSALVFAVPGTVSAIRFFATTTVTAAGENYTGQLWQASLADPNNTAVGGVPLGTVTVDSSTIVAGTWNVLNFAVPVVVAANTLYRPALNNAHNQGRYVSTAGFWTAAAIVNGNITGLRNGSALAGYTGTINNGSFKTGAGPGVYPSDTFGGNGYFIDVVFNATSTRVPDFMPFFV